MFPSMGLRDTGSASLSSSDTAKCRVLECTNGVHRRGMCTRHYFRHRRHGDPKKGRRRRGELTEFVTDIAIPFTGEECLLWPFAIRNNSGYGQAKLDGKLRLVHRYVCEKVNGIPPEVGFHAAHACGNRRCVNPLHLSWKTPLQNEADKKVHGTLPVGENHPNSTLSDDEVIAIRVLRGRLPNKQISAIFNVSRSAVSLIQIGKSRSAKTTPSTKAS